MSFFHICTASESDLGSHSSDTDSNATPRESHARFAVALVDDEADGESHDGTATETGNAVLANTTFASRMIATSPTTTPDKKPATPDEEGFIAIAPQVLVPPTLHISGGMFDELVIPQSTMFYTEIILSHCTCFKPLDPTTFQHNPTLIRIVFSNSQLNLRQFEEKLCEHCGNLTHIDLQNFSDISVDGQPIITPERFAQIAHPCLLQRILSGSCTVLISHPDRPTDCYTLDEMKERFLSSVLQLRSLTKAKETVSMYQSLIDMITTEASKLDPSQLATAGGRVLLGVYSGL